MENRVRTVNNMKEVMMMLVFSLHYICTYVDKSVILKTGKRCFELKGQKQNFGLLELYQQHVNYYT